jgi:hypothetical protein
MLDLFNLLIAAIFLAIVAFMVRAVRLTRASVARDRDARPAIALEAVADPPTGNQGRVAGIVGSILLLGGLGMLAGSAFTYRQQAAFVDSSQKAAGVVIDNQWRENRIQSGDETPGGWAPVVRFEDAARNVITFTSEVSAYPSPAYAIGEAVEVLYDPDDPRHSEISDFITLWLIPSVLFGIGFVMALFGGILLRSTRTSA